MTAFWLRLRLWGIRLRFCGIHRRIWWIDRYCDWFGHRWVRRESGAAYDCPRCRRKRLMIWNRDTGKTKWIVTP
jgi:hypothetical protein